jgi:hypothetical protein
VGHVYASTCEDPRPYPGGARSSRFLLANLLGEPGLAMADRVLAALAADPSIGMVFPEDPWVVGWHAGRECAPPLPARFGLQDLPDHAVFPAGGMFWARVAALAPLLDPALVWDDYPEEPVAHDGSCHKGIERLLPLGSAGEGRRCATTYVPGLRR